MAGNLGKYLLNKTQLKYNLLNETQLETHSGRVGQLSKLGQLTHWHEGGVLAFAESYSPRQIGQSQMALGGVMDFRGGSLITPWGYISIMTKKTNICVNILY